MRGLPARAVRFWWGRGIADDVPALTYYLLLSLAPAAVGIATLEAVLLGSAADAREVADALNRFLPSAIHGDVEGLVVGARNNSVLYLGLALLAMLWTTSGAIGVIERVESRLLDCPRHGIVLGRLRNMALGATVALAVAVAAAGAPVIGDAAAALRLQEAFPGSLAFLLSLGGAIVVFAGVFRFAPRSNLRWRSALVGAVPAGIAVQVVPMIYGLYLGAAAGIAAVRIFLLLAVLLLALYVMATVLLAGAGVAVRTELELRARR